MGHKAGVTIEWAPPGTAPVAATCRNCGMISEAPVLLTAVARLPDQPLLEVCLLDCRVCGCAFARDVPDYDYVGDHVGDDVRRRDSGLAVSVYVEAAAGLWPIMRTLARLTLPPGSRYP